MNSVGPPEDLKVGLWVSYNKIKNLHVFLSRLLSVTLYFKVSVDKIMFSRPAGSMCVLTVASLKHQCAN